MKKKGVKSKAIKSDRKESEKEKQFMQSKQQSEPRAPRSKPCQPARFLDHFSTAEQSQFSLKGLDPQSETGRGYMFISRTCTCV